MESENDMLMMYIIIRNLRYTGREKKDSKRKPFFTMTLHKLVEKI